MALPQGIAFRATSGYVTDGPNDYFQNHHTNNYPTTSTQGNTVGFESGNLDFNANRNAGIDARLAGICFDAFGDSTFRIDLPSTGSYNVRCAVGDYGGGGPPKAQLQDGTTPFLTVNKAQASDMFYDATNTGYSSANWPGSNTALNRTFSSTIFRLIIQGSVAANAVTSYIYIESAGGGGSTSYSDGVAFTALNSFTPSVKMSFKDALTYSETNSFTPTVKMSYKDTLTFAETNGYSVLQGALTASVTFATTQGVTLVDKWSFKDSLSFSETNAASITHLAKLSDSLVFAETNTVSAVGTIAGLSLTYSITTGYSIAETLSSAPTSSVATTTLWSRAATATGIWSRATTATGSWTLQ